MDNKVKRALSASTMASLLITSSVVSANVKAAAVTPPENPRLWGADRYETAVKVSQAGWTTGSDYAVIASGEGYADALSAAPLAKVNNAPILLTQKGALNASTLNELKRLNVKHVFIIGGQGVVSQAVEDTIKSQITTDIQRLWGQDRYETAVKVASKLAEKTGAPTKVVLASGDGYADALSAAPVAAIEGMPILLTESKTLSKPTADYIKANTGITKTFAIGGYASVSDDTMKLVPGAQRLGGANRYETNAAVINAFATDFDFKNAYIALGEGSHGDEFADALSASAIASRNGNPVIITNKVLNSTTQSLAKSHVFPSSVITVLGGTANVPDEVVNGIKVTGSLLNESGKTYTDVINGNADIAADNIALKGNVKGDLYLNGNNASLSNITVDGTIYINPGDKGVSNLDTVTAKNIVVLSGAQESIHLKNVKAEKLTVSSRDNARIVSEGTTAITTTEVKSQATLEAAAGSFGNINVPETAQEKAVEFRGTFDKAVVVEGNVDIKTAAGAKLSGLVVSENVKESGIKVEGTGTIKNIQVKSSTAALNIDKNIAVTGKIEAVNKDSVKSENSSITSKVEQKSSDSMTDITTGSTTPSPVTGGGGGGSTGGQTQQTYYMTATTASGNTYTFKLGDKATIDNMTVSDFYDTYIAGKDANSASVQLLGSMIKDKVDSKDINVGGQDLNTIISNILVSSGHNTMAGYAANEDYTDALASLFGKDYDDFSQFTHSLVAYAKDPASLSYRQDPITVGGKTVTSIKVMESSTDTAGNEVYYYNNTEKGTVIFNTISQIKARYLNGVALGATKMSDLKSKYICIKIYLDNDTNSAYTITGQNGQFTVAGPTKTYTIGITAQ